MSLDHELNEVEIILKKKTQNKWENQLSYNFLKDENRFLKKKTNFNICKSIENLFIKKSYSLEYTYRNDKLSFVKYERFHVTRSMEKKN